MKAYRGFHITDFLLGPDTGEWRLVNAMTRSVSL